MFRVTTFVAAIGFTAMTPAAFASHTTTPDKSDLTQRSAEYVVSSELNGQAKHPSDKMDQANTKIAGIHAPREQISEATHPIAQRLDAQAANQGDGIAEEKIGDLYWWGSANLPRDQAEAIRHYRSAASRGIASSERKLAIAYANGEGVPPDDALMLLWSRKAAVRGDPVAAGMLGYAIMIGLDGSYDLVAAATWLTIAVENARPGIWRSHTAAYARDIKSRLTPSERAIFKVRLARWRSALGRE